MSDIASSQVRPRVPPNAFKSAPLVVLNNFSPQQKQLALAANLFQVGVRVLLLCWIVYLG